VPLSHGGSKANKWHPKRDETHRSKQRGMGRKEESSRGASRERREGMRRMVKGEKRRRRKAGRGERKNGKGKGKGKRKGEGNGWKGMRMKFNSLFG
jgi:hypothetical protein